MSKKIFVLLLVFIGLLQTCNTTEPPPLSPPDDNSVNSDIELTSLWTDLYRIALKWNKSPLESTPNTFTYELKRVDEGGNEITKTFKITGSDTIYVDGNEGDSLETGKNYTYKVFAYTSTGKLRDTSKTVIAKTLTATSHEIVWQIDTLGQPGNALDDVWGIDENNVWAVGGVSLPDGGSNVIKWNGMEWRSFPIVEANLNGIFGFTENDIWVVGGGTYGNVHHWDGTVWKRHTIITIVGDTTWGLNAVWGSAPDDVWAVGKQGTIIHWDGMEWKKFESGVIISLNDVWGQSSNEVYCVGYQNPDFNTSTLLKYDGLSWEKIRTIQIVGYDAETIWKAAGGKVLTGGKTLLEFDGDNYIEVYTMGRTRHIKKIRGSGVNNIFTVGHFGEITHYNGESWKSIEDYEVPNGRFRIFEGIWTNGNKVFVVGIDEAGIIFLLGTIN